MAKSVSARDQQIASTSNTLSQSTAGVREQVISVTDLISEGPIYGLVDSEASIFLNDDRIVSANAASTPASRELSVSLTNASTAATLSNTVYGIGSTTRRLMTVAKAVEATSTGVSLVESSVSAGTTAISLSTAAAFFDNTWMLNPAITGFVNLVLYENNREVNRLVGTFSAISSTTSAEFTASTSNNVILDTFIEEAATKTLQIEVSAMSWITIDSGTVNATLDNPWLLSTGTYTVTLSSYALSGLNLSSEVFRNYSRFEGVSAQFRTGHLNQSPMVDFLGVSNTQIPQGSGFSPYPLEYIDSLSENPSDTAAAPAYITSGTSGFGLTSQQAQEVDEVRLTFTYGAMQVSKSTSGTTGRAHAIYKIELILNRGLDTSTVVLVPQRLHSAESTTPISFEEVINLEPFKPFTDFAVRVTRLTRHDGRGIRENASNKKSEWSMQAASSITSVTSVIKENLTYPYTAYANVTFSSKEFNNVPTRTYHARGLKVQVPSNYTTREESLANGNGIAVSDLYTGLWDGSFREDKVYTNNPAWIFYDILTNNRYGLGDWIRESDIDKYTLYRVGRYCDELVSDGKGGLEPRFTSNIYLTKAADAYKVLKDMASSFISMIYWIDGQITTVIDQPKDAVYTFSKGNVINGAFNYESTGSKTRPNQVLVNWNNPEADYKQEILIVEDKENIVKTGRIITEDAVAFGCTSQAQAQRYGRWKLWTAANQTEIVSFKTSLNAAFLVPGDVIKIQDSDRYAIQYSGRISSGLLNTTTVPLDREVTLNANSTYYLSVLLEGDSTEVGDSTEPTETTVETLEVTTAAGTVSSLTVATEFSLIPTAGSIWVLREVTAEGTVAASAKDYKILAISEDSKQEYSITAVEHYNEKFTAVEDDFTLVQDEPVVSSTEIVPAPKNIYVLKHPDPTKEGNEFSITWDVPQKSGSPYTKISGYEVVHNIPGYDSPYKVFGSVNKMTFVGVEEGSYSISVRTINTIENRSNFTTTVFNLEDPFPLKVPRAQEGLGIGGSANSGLRLSDTYVLNFEVSTPGVISPIVAPEDTFTGNITGINTISSSLTDDVYSVIFDNSASALLATKYNNTPSHGVPYHYDALAANGVPESTFNTLTGTVSLPENSIFVTGSGTSFTTDFALGDIIRFNSLQAAKIVTIINDTNLLIDRSFSSAISSSSYAVNGLRLEFEKDILVGKFTKSGSTSTIKSFMGIDTTLTGPQGEAGERGPGRWHIPVTALPTTSAEADTAWINSAGNQPSVAIADDQAWFFTGTLTNPSSQTVWIYNGSSWENQEEVIDGNLIVTGTITADAIAANTITANEINAEVGNFGQLVADVGTFTTLDTDTLDANSVIAREIQVFPEGGTAPTINGTTLAGAGVDIKQDGDVYIGNASANTYMFWDQSEGTLTLRGELNADDITAGSISADRISAGSIDADKIAAGAITADKITADAVTADKIDVTNLAAVSADLGAITAGTMQNSGVNAIPDANSAPAGSESGAFIDLTQGKFVFGDASKYILWDGTDLTLSGVAIDATSTIDAIAGVTVQEDGTQELEAATTFNFTTGLNVETNATTKVATISVDAQPTTYSVSIPASTTKLRLSGSDSTTDDIEFVGAGTTTVARTTDSKFTITSTETDTLDSVTGRGNTTTNEVTVGSLTVSNNATINGNLTVSGTTTTVNSETINLADNIITLNSNLDGATAPTQDAGIEINRGSGTDVALVWDESATRWSFTNNGIDYYNIPVPTEYNAYSWTVSDGTNSESIASGETVKFVGSDATTVSYDSSTNTFTISSTDTDTDTTYSAATASTLGLAKLFSGTVQSVAANTVSATASRTYGVQFNNDNQLVVNVPWSDTNTTYSAATNTTLGLIKTNYSQNAKNYPIKVDGSGDAYVNVPWTDTDTTYSAATTTALGLIQVGYSENGKNYPVELDTSNNAYVNVPWSDTNTTYSTATSATLGLVRIGYAENGKNYPVELDLNDKMYVNVPWSDTNTTYSAATTTALGLIQVGYTENGKNYPVELDANNNAYVNVPWSDTDTTYSTATSSALGLVKIGFPENGKDYPVELNASNQMYVNVPWSDTNTTYTAGTLLDLSGTEFSVDLTELTAHVQGTDTDLASTDTLPIIIAGTQYKKAISEIDLSLFKTSGLTAADAESLGGQPSSYYLSTDTTFGGDVSGTYNAIVVADDSHEHSTYLPYSGGTVTGTLTVQVNSSTNKIQLYTEKDTLNIADTFTDTTTDKSYIYFAAGDSSNDPGYIMHETSEAASPDERNEGVLHLCPSDDNSGADYVSIHGTNDPDKIKLFTDGAISGVTTLYATTIDLGNNPFTDTTVGNWNTAYGWGNHADAGYLTTYTDTNTTYSIALSDGSSGEVKVDLTAGGSGSGTDSVTFKAGANVTLSRTNDVVTIASTDTNTTYSAATTTALGLIQVGYTEDGKNYPVELDANNNAYVNVPWSDTNTTYSTATSSVLGLVKIGFPESGKNYPVELNGSDQMYVNVPWTDTDTTYSAATTTALGLIQVGYSENGKNYPVELDTSNNAYVNVPWTDNNTTYTAGNGLVLSGTEFKINDPVNLTELTETTDATDDKIMLWDESASIWKYMTLDNLQDAIDTNTTYAVGDGGLTEKNFTTTLKNKLDGIATNANNYSLPSATSAALGGIKLGSDTAQTVAAETVSATDNRTYALQVNASGQGVINVPWSNTTYTAGTGLSLTGTEFSVKTAEFAPRVTGTTTLAQNSYSRIARILGDDLGSGVRVHLSGTTGSVVVDIIADILVNHYQDIHIMTQSGAYTQLDLKVHSNSSNEDFDLYAQYTTGTGTTLSLKAEYFPLSSETITVNPTDTAYTGGTELVHSTTVGMKMTQSSGNADMRIDGTYYANGGNSGEWNTAYGWGNHADASYATQASVDTKVSLSGDTMTGPLTISDSLAAGTPILKLHNSDNGQGVQIRFTDVAAGTSQFGGIIYRHQDTLSYGSGASFQIGSTETTTTILADGKLMYAEGIYSKPATGTGAGTRKDANWDTAYGWGNHATAGYLTSIPTATDTVLGGIKVGDRLTITDGVLSADVQSSSYTLPTATDTVLGGVKIGDGIDITSGVISIKNHSANFDTITADLGTFTTVDTQVLDADSVIARTIQVYPVGGTAPTITGTTLAGSGAVIKDDGDVMIGDSAGKHIFYDQSAGSLAIRSGTSGSRTEFLGDVIKVFDGTTLRVKIGNLSA